MSILDNYADSKLSDEASRSIITTLEGQRDEHIRHKHEALLRIMDLRSALAAAQTFVRICGEEHDSQFARDILAEIKALLAQDLFAHEKGDEA